MSKIKVTLRRSLAGKNMKNKKIAAALGLRKIGQTRTFEKNAAIDGMIKRVAYLVSVTEE